MFARSTKRIIHWLCRKKIIKQQDMDVYAYGIQNLLIFLFNLFSFMVIGAIFHTIMYTAVFILFYSVAFVNKKLSHLANKKVSQL